MWLKSTNQILCLHLHALRSLFCEVWSGAHFQGARKENRCGNWQLPTRSLSVYFVGSISIQSAAVGRHALKQEKFLSLATIPRKDGCLLSRLTIGCCRNSTFQFISRQTRFWDAWEALYGSRWHMYAAALPSVIRSAESAKHRASDYPTSRSRSELR